MRCVANIMLNPWIITHFGWGYEPRTTSTGGYEDIEFKVETQSDDDVTVSPQDTIPSFDKKPYVDLGTDWIQDIIQLPLLNQNKGSIHLKELEHHSMLTSVQFNTNLVPESKKFHVSTTPDTSDIKIEDDTSLTPPPYTNQINSDRIEFPVFIKAKSFESSLINSNIAFSSDDEGCDSHSTVKNTLNEEVSNHLSFNILENRYDGEIFPNSVSNSSALKDDDSHSTTKNLKYSDNIKRLNHFSPFTSKDTFPYVISKHSEALIEKSDNLFEEIRPISNSSVLKQYSNNLPVKEPPSLSPQMVALPDDQDLCSISDVSENNLVYQKHSQNNLPVKETPSLSPQMVALPDIQDSPKVIKQYSNYLPLIKSPSPEVAFPDDQDFVYSPDVSKNNQVYQKHSQNNLPVKETPSLSPQMVALPDIQDSPKVIKQYSNYLPLIKSPSPEVAFPNDQDFVYSPDVSKNNQVYQKHSQNNLPVKETPSLSPQMVALPDIQDSPKVIKQYSNYLPLIKSPSPEVAFPDDQDFVFSPDVSKNNLVYQKHSQCHLFEECKSQSITKEKNDNEPFVVSYSSVCTTSKGTISTHKKKRGRPIKKFNFGIVTGSKKSVRIDEKSCNSVVKERNIADIKCEINKPSMISSNSIYTTSKDLVSAPFQKKHGHPSKQRELNPDNVKHSKNSVCIESKSCNLQSINIERSNSGKKHPNDKSLTKPHNSMFVINNFYSLKNKSSEKLEVVANTVKGSLSSDSLESNCKLQSIEKEDSGEVLSNVKTFIVSTSISTTMSNLTSTVFKKKRGRPRKKKNLTPDNANLSNSAYLESYCRSQSVKKDKHSSGESSNDNKTLTTDSISRNFTSTPLKKKRGRPCKGLELVLNDSDLLTTACLESNYRLQSVEKEKNNSDESSNNNKTLNTDAISRDLTSTSLKKKRGRPCKKLELIPNDANSLNSAGLKSKDKSQSIENNKNNSDTSNNNKTIIYTSGGTISRDSTPTSLKRKHNRFQRQFELDSNITDSLNSTCRKSDCTSQSNKRDENNSDKSLSKKSSNYVYL